MANHSQTPRLLTIVVVGEESQDGTHAKLGGEAITGDGLSYSLLMTSAATALSFAIRLVREAAAVVGRNPDMETSVLLALGVRASKANAADAASSFVMQYEQQHHAPATRPDEVGGRLGAMIAATSNPVEVPVGSKWKCGCAGAEVATVIDPEAEGLPAIRAGHVVLRWESGVVAAYPRGQFGTHFTRVDE